LQKVFVSLHLTNLPYSSVSYQITQLTSRASVVLVLLKTKLNLNGGWTNLRVGTGIAMLNPAATLVLMFIALSTGGSPGCGSVTATGLSVLKTLKLSFAELPFQLTCTVRILIGFRISGLRNTPWLLALTDPPISIASTAIFFTYLCWCACWSWSFGKCDHLNWEDIDSSCCACANSE